MRGCGRGFMQAAQTCQTGVKRVVTVKAEALRLATGRNGGPCSAPGRMVQSGWRGWRWRGWRRGESVAAAGLGQRYSSR